MRLTSRYVHPTPHGGRCRVRIYLPDEPERDAPVVICSELSNNPGMSITDAAQTIAAEVIRGHRLPTPLVWIEHYPAESRRPGAEETFDLAIFSSYEITERAPYLAQMRLRLGEPTWKPLDRHSVEVLIGQPLRKTDRRNPWPLWLSQLGHQPTASLLLIIHAAIVLPTAGSMLRRSA